MDSAAAASEAAPTTGVAVKDGEEAAKTSPEEDVETGLLVPCPGLLSWEDWLWLTRWSFNEEQIYAYPYLSGEVLGCEAGFTFPCDDEVVVWEDDVWNLKEIQRVPPGA